jgi:hypothetical protein
MEPISVELEACNSSLNCRHSWQFYIDRDLFGQVQAQVAFGRKGCPGRTRRSVYDRETKAQALLRLSLRRRATSPGGAGSLSNTASALQVLQETGFRLPVRPAA